MSEKTRASPTPGPWKRDGRKIVGPHRNGVVALVPVVRDGGVFECEANAHLIAAAPEQNEALKAAIPLLRHLVNTAGKNVADSARGVLHEAEAAIRKAEGADP